MCGCCCCFVFFFQFRYQCEPTVLYGIWRKNVLLFMLIGILISQCHWIRDRKTPKRLIFNNIFLKCEFISSQTYLIIQYLMRNVCWRDKIHEKYKKSGCIGTQNSPLDLVTLMDGFGFFRIFFSSRVKKAAAMSKKIGKKMVTICWRPSTTYWKHFRCMSSQAMPWVVLIFFFLEKEVFFSSVIWSSGFFSRLFNVIEWRMEIWPTWRCHILSILWFVEQINLWHITICGLRTHST